MIKSLTKQIFTLLYIFIFCYGVSFSQTINIIGNISTLQNPVRNARIVFDKINGTTENYITYTDSSGNYFLSIVTGIAHEYPITPSGFELAQNYPNPFINTTAITYILEEQSEINIKIYDILGRLIKHLDIGLKNPGINQITWDGTNDQNVKVTKGVYFYQIQSGTINMVKKMVFGPGGTSLTIPYSNYSPRKLNKYTEIKEDVFNISIRSVDSTDPFIVANDFKNTIVSNDTTLNFTMETARIILGRSIDAVQIGDDSVTVINKLGTPDTITGGDFNGYIFNYYKYDNKHSQMSVFVIIETDTIYKTSTTFIEVNDPYKGKTKEGVYIGISRNMVHELIGNPDSTDPNGPGIVDKYYKPGSNVLFLFVYDNTGERLVRIQMH